ncbi:nucleotidyltransferase domain-containing protein [Cellulomonas biazotea]|uniref:Polymerase nucleotidyl transferase domain-containing protein n=1 Tax=Cellulomonas biazotea TaxID=1709 RepID=A0A402DV51_9CELL|nr:nucleotidyltransferase domain-containing protein [Cellulomonas biazotea]GCE77975.1 hypothetical protein CBZ_30310 [Cellulomonas biazotea]
MDLSHPLRSLIPTLDAAALEVLAGTESGLSATQVAKLAGKGSRPGLILALDRLTRAGLVHAVPSNTGHLYRLNRDHLLARAVLDAATARRELLHRLGAVIDDLIPHPVHASVYGSTARGEATEDSDVDLLIVTPTEADRYDDTWREQMRTLEDRVHAWTGNRLEVLTLSAHGVGTAHAAGEPLIRELWRDAVTVHGPDFPVLMTTVLAEDA